MNLLCHDDEIKYLHRTTDERAQLRSFTQLNLRAAVCLNFVTLDSYQRQKQCVGVADKISIKRSTSRQTANEIINCGSISWSEFRQSCRKVSSMYPSMALRR